MTSQNTVRYFSNASNSTFHNISFTHINGNANIYKNSEQHVGSRLLLNNISSGAFHDAAERGDPPRCYPNTRMAIRAEILEWITAAAGMRKLILWMYGPAGSGKTAISQSIAEDCQKYGLLAASFFFGRTAAGRNDTSRFVATIAYQLSRFIPQIRDQILSTIEQDPAIFSRALTTQMQLLIIEPLKSVPPFPRPVFMITDGVDESSNRESQTNLLNAIGTAVSELRHLPLIFLIASRPEYEIREAFDGNWLSPMVKRLLLDDNYKPHKDIRLYLYSTFQVIRDKYLRLGGRLPSPWPTNKDINLLVSKASGQFIFAATVMKFIDSSRHHPPERLNIILGLLAPGNETPFALLDALYRYILSSVADLPRVLEVLTLLTLGQTDHLTRPSLTPTVHVIEAQLGYTVGTVLVDMHALVHIPPPTDRRPGLRIHHASLYDFLTDRSRAQDFYIDPTQGHISLSRRWLKFAANYSHIPKPFSFSDCIYGFVLHCNRLSTDSREIAEDLASFNIKEILEKCSNAGDLHRISWDTFFKVVEKQATSRADVFPRLRNAFDAFVLNRLSKYLPALQCLIPFIFVHNEHVSSFRTLHYRRIFDFFLDTMHISRAERGPGHQLDSTLLHMHMGRITMDTIVLGSNSIFSTLFRDRTRSGQFCADADSFATVAKHLIKTISAQPREDKYILKLTDGNMCHREFPRYDIYPTINIGIGLLAEWFNLIVPAASPDLELVVLLRRNIDALRRLQENRQTLQYLSRNPIPEYLKEIQKIEEVSFKYIERCDIPDLVSKHTHFPTANNCMVCGDMRRAEAENPSQVIRHTRRSDCN